MSIGQDQDDISTSFFIEWRHWDRGHQLNSSFQEKKMKLFLYKCVRHWLAQKKRQICLCTSEVVCTARVRRIRKVRSVSSRLTCALIWANLFISQKKVLFCYTFCTGALTHSSQTDIGVFFFLKSHWMVFISNMELH